MTLPTQLNASRYAFPPIIERFSSQDAPQCLEGTLFAAVHHASNADFNRAVDKMCSILVACGSRRVRDHMALICSEEDVTAFIILNPNAPDEIDNIIMVNLKGLAKLSKTLKKRHREWSRFHLPLPIQGFLVEPSAWKSYLATAKEPFIDNRSGLTDLVHDVSVDQAEGSDTPHRKHRASDANLDDHPIPAKKHASSLPAHPLEDIPPPEQIASPNTIQNLTTIVRAATYEGVDISPMNPTQVSIEALLFGTASTRPL